MGKGRETFLVGLAACFLACASALYAQIPQAIDFQGTLADAQGSPASGERQITFRLYHTASGGSAVWSESKTLSVYDGVYSTQLGNQTALTHDVLATDNLWLGVTPAGGDELVPRVRIVAVPYALRAKYAEQATATDALPPGAMVLSEKPNDADLLAAGYGNPVPVSLGNLNAWQPISVEGAPSVSYRSNAVWTGDRMIVWDGDGQTGGIYDPEADTWATMNTDGAPSGMGELIWADDRMIAWGGPDSCGIYSPSEDSWQSMTTTGAPSEGPAVWTGDKMIAIGTTDGGIYDINTDSWQPISMDNAPGGEDRVAFWIGDKMLVWGGAPGTGGLYDPNTDSWSAISSEGEPSFSEDFIGVWTGSEMIALQERSMSATRYNMSQNQWDSLSLPISHFHFSNLRAAFWTGLRVGLLGSYSEVSGVLYEPTHGEWIPMSMIGCPIGSDSSSIAVWTGENLIVFASEAVGAIYDPSADKQYYLYTKQ